MSKLFKKTLLLMILLFGVIAMVVSFSSGWMIYNKLTEEYKSKAIAIAKTIADSNVETFLNRDASTIQALIDQCDEIEGVSYILVAYEGGEIISHTLAPRVPPTLRQLAEAPRGARDDVLVTTLRLKGMGDFLNISSPILAGVAGYVHVGMDLDAIRSYIWGAIIRLQFITFIIFLASVVIAYLFINSISRPLIQLTDYAAKVAARDFSASIDIRSRDEMGLLAGAMTTMAGEIKNLITGLERAVGNATEELRETVAYVSAIIRNLADGLVVLDSRGRITSYNPALLGILGLREDITGKPAAEALGEAAAGFIEDRKRRMDYERRISGGSPFEADSSGAEPHRRAVGKTAELTARKPDGSIIPIELSVTTVHLKGEWNSIGIVRDITDRKRAEEALRASRENLEKRVEERTRELSDTNRLLKQEISERLRVENDLRNAEEKYRGIFENAVEGIFQVTVDGRFISANPAMARILGYDSPEELIQSVSDVARQHYVYPERRKEFVRLIWENGVVQGFEAEQYRKDGTKIWVSLNARPILNEDGEIAYIEGILMDITERTRTKQELLKVEKLQSIGALAGGIAHDFNNLLTAILGNISAVKPALGVDHRGFQRLTEAEKACLRAKGLTKQLLAFAKGGAPIKRTIPICEVLKDAAELALRGANVRCEITAPDDIRPVEVDADQIGQVFSNLVINAQQAMPRGGVIEITASDVNISAHDGVGLPAGSYVRVDVKDRGPGIPEEHLSKVFDLYFTTKPKGSGLGLATAYAIINNHGGAISVDSKPGDGAVFHVYLPASTGEVTVADVREGTVITGKGRILLMDDEEAIRVLAGELLTMLGYESEVAADGMECIAKYRDAMARGASFDAVILDLTVPGGMGGKSALDYLRALDPHVKAIVSSGYSDAPVMANYREYGFSGVIPKPYDVAELSRVLSVAVNSDLS